MNIDVDLNAELESYVLQAVANGEYGSVSEVIHEALLQWKATRTLSEAELRRLWMDGVESGPGQYADIAAIKRAANVRLSGEG